MQEEPFILENYLNISAHSPEYKVQLEHVYREMGQTSEGREVIERAFELNYRKRISVEGSKEGATEAKSLEGRVILAESQLSQATYRGVDGQRYDTSLNRVAFHELYHVSDEESRHLVSNPKEAHKIIKEMLPDLMIQVALNHTDKNEIVFEEARKMIFGNIEEGDDSLVLELRKAMDNAMPHEVRAIEATNDYMSKYYDVVPRKAHADQIYNGNPELEVRTMQVGPASLVTP